MEKNNKLLIKTTSILAIGQFLPKLLSIITLPLLTGSFTTSEYGIYDLVISFSSLFLPLLTLMIQLATFRFLIDSKDDENKKKYISNSMYSIFALSAVFLVITLSSACYIKQYQSIIIIAYFIYFFESIYDLMGQIARGFGKNTLYSFGTIIYSIINMLLLLFALLFDSINIYVALIVVAISYCIATIFLGIKLKIFIYVDKKYININTIKELLTYSVPIIPSSIGLWIVNLSDRLIITGFLGAAENGIYSAATKIPNIFATVFNVFNLAWTEVAARSINDKNSDKYYSTLFYNLYSFMIGALLGLITISPLMYNILVDSKFHDGYNQLPILYCGILFSCFVSFYGGLYVALKKTKQVGISSMIGAIINAGINLIFIRRIGLYAASISTLISFGIILIYRVIEIQKYIKITYDIKSIIFGVIFLSITIIGFYFDNCYFTIINIVVTLIYNIIFNKFLLKFLKMIIYKVKEKRNNEV